MKLFSVSILAYATLYVRAEDQDAAIATARGYRNLSVTAEGAVIDGTDITTSGLAFDSPDLAPITLSPGLTLGDLEWDGNDAGVEVVHDYDATQPDPSALILATLSAALGEAAAAPLADEIVDALNAAGVTLR